MSERFLWVLSIALATIPFGLAQPRHLPPHP